MKTEITANVGKHAFEVAGLGLAPFRFVGMSVNSITYPDGTTQPGGTCDYCGIGIANECHVLSADGKRFKVGCDCIAKVSDAGLLRAYKTSLAFRDHNRKLAAAKAARVSKELTQLIADNSALFASRPHPRGFLDRTTGAPLTFLDSVKWSLGYCGASGRAALLKGLKNKVAEFSAPAVDKQPATV